MSMTELNQDRKVETRVRHYGFSPLLYAVAVGSYISNSSYGAAAAQTGSYGPNQVASGNFSFLFDDAAKNINAKTSCDIRKEDTKAYFVCDITLDRSTAVPAGVTTGELRIKVQPLVGNQPARYAQFLPEPDRSFDLPIFTDVEILRIGTGGNWEPALPAATDTQLRARLLDSQTIALVSTNYATSPPPDSGLSVVGLNALLGGAPGDGPIQITLRGYYRTM